jgi:hypothetical protein
LKSRKDANKRPGGFGMFMMRKMMDDVFYNHKGNVCVMKKKLKSDDFRFGEKARTAENATAKSLPPDN